MTRTMPHRGNSARPLRASTLVVSVVELAGVARKFVVCPSCGRNAQVKRNELVAHTDTAGARCADSRRALINDLTESQWTNAHAIASRHAAQIRAPRSHRKPQPATPPTLADIARRHAQAVEIRTTQDAKLRAAIRRLENALA